MSKPKAEGSIRQKVSNQIRALMCTCRCVRQRFGDANGTSLKFVPCCHGIYLFANLLSSISAVIRPTLGVQQSVRFGAEFAQAPDSLVADIRAMEARLRGGPEPLPFKGDDEVEITEGRLAGITAKVLSCAESRVLLLFQLLGSMRNLGLSQD